MSRERIRVRFLPHRGEAPLAEVDAPAGAWLTAVASRAGVPIVHDCDGQGVCSTCRVRIEAGASACRPAVPAERVQLGERVDEGWRLCCQVRVYGDAVVRLPEPGFAYAPDLQRDGP